MQKSNSKCHSKKEHNYRREQTNVGINTREDRYSYREISYLRKIEYIVNILMHSRTLAKHVFAVKKDKWSSADWNSQLTTVKYAMFFNISVLKF